MKRSRGKARRSGLEQAWRYLGASGLLQPLSEEFLYRSPQSPLSDTARHRRETRDETC
jgi:hypothetical protein